MGAARPPQFCLGVATVLIVKEHAAEVPLLIPAHPCFASFPVFMSVSPLELKLQ
jgi:hypothetical protein